MPIYYTHSEQHCTKEPYTYTLHLEVYGRAHVWRTRIMRVSLAPVSYVPSCKRSALRRY